MDSAWVEIILIFVLIVINGLFAMSEIAMVSARKVRLQQLAEDGEPSAQVALNMSKEPNRLLSTVQVGITLVSEFTGRLAAPGWPAALPRRWLPSPDWNLKRRPGAGAGGIGHHLLLVGDRRTDPQAPGVEQPGAGSYA